MSILFYSLVKGLALNNCLIHALLILIQISFIDLLQIIKITMNAFVSLLILQFDIIEKLLICSHFISNCFEIRLNSLYSWTNMLELTSLHLLYNLNITNQKWHSPQRYKIGKKQWRLNKIYRYHYSLVSSMNSVSDLVITSKRTARSVLSTYGQISWKRIFMVFLKNWDDFVSKLMKI